MVEEKKSLQNDEMGKVIGGGKYYDPTYDDEAFEPYTDTKISVSCPKCNSRKIWYNAGFFGIEEMDTYWCRDCGWLFGYNEMGYHGCNGDW